MNDRVKIQNIEILSKNWYVLKKVVFEYFGNDGKWQQQNREAYDRGNGATILLYNQPSGNIILTRQFRMPTYLNGNESGMLIEVQVYWIKKIRKMQFAGKPKRKQDIRSPMFAKYLKRICLRTPSRKCYTSL
jgi:hypothetical protein